MKSSEEYNSEREDLKSWRRRDQLRQGSTAQPVPSGRRYQRKHKSVTRELDRRMRGE